MPISIKFKVFNPLAGTYAEVDTREQCLSAVAKAALEMYLSHTHQSPYSVCEVNDNGTETWRNAAGDEIIDPEELEQRIVDQLGTHLSSISPTPVESLP